MENLTIDEAFNGLTELVLKGVQFSGSLIEIDQKREVVQNLLKTVENALDLKSKENG
tara:strand:- start:749 stop:919 length:171 start_codon:yes stop_codon:yes gene_type:complete